MLQHSAIAVPLSRNDIRGLTHQIRRSIGANDDLLFPIMEFVEIVLPQKIPGFVLAVCEETEMGDCHGIALPEKNLINIREDVYDRACRGEGRDRMTVAHELGHFFLHRPGKVAMARVLPGAVIPAYKNPEWQVMAFAAELLMPAHLIRSLSVEQISVLCCVSLSAAQVQKKNVR